MNDNILPANPWPAERSSAKAPESLSTDYETIWNAIYDYGARLYNADLGRMLSADTIVPEPGNPQSLNPYSYVLNNPTTYTDPTGNMWMDEGGTCSVYLECATTVHLGPGNVAQDEPAAPRRPTLPLPFIGGVGAGVITAVDPVVGIVAVGTVMCVVYCDEASHTIRDFWHDIMSDTVVLIENTPEDAPDMTDIPPPGWKWVGGAEGSQRTMDKSGAS